MELVHLPVCCLATQQDDSQYFINVTAVSLEEDPLVIWK